MDHLIADIDEIGERVEYPDVLRDILEMMDKGIMPDIAEIRNDIKRILKECTNGLSKT